LELQVFEPVGIFTFRNVPVARFSENGRACGACEVSKRELRASAVKRFANPSPSTSMNLLIGFVDSCQQSRCRSCQPRATLLLWIIGKYISQTVLGNERGLYGKQILPELATKLS